MNLFLLIITMLITNFGFAQTIQLQFNRQSEQEALFNVVYTGPATELILPSRGRLVSLTEQANVRVAQGKILVGNPENDNGDEFTVNFSYSYLLGSGGRVSITAQHWFPTIKNTEVEYSLNSIDEAGTMLIYPYLSDEDNVFSFAETQNPSLVLGNFLTDSAESPVPITVHSASPMDVSVDQIGQIYTYLSAYFGDLNLHNIVIINNNVLSSQAFIDNGTLFITMFGRGTQEQLSSVIADAWKNKKTSVTARYFDMFKDTILRLDPLALKKEDTNTVANAETNEAPATETNTEENSTTKELNPASLTIVPRNDYYENLFNQGFDPNKVCEVNVNGIFQNFGLLHMAYYNIGNQKILDGIKAFYKESESNTNTVITEQEITNSSTNLATSLGKGDAQTVTVSSSNSGIDWSVITQNSLTEPLFTLYSKEVLGSQALIPTLIAKGNLATRNSLYIPNLNFENNDGEITEVDWKGFKSVRLNINRGSYTLDEERQVPRHSYIEATYNFDPSVQQLHAKVLFAADRALGLGQQNLRKHLYIMNFQSSEDRFDIPAGSNIYVVVSHILSNYKGSLRSGIKESFFVVDENNIISHIATHTRI